MMRNPKKGEVVKSNPLNRYRNMKDRLAASEFQKYQNRLAFGQDAEKEYNSTGEGFGMVGMAGKIKIERKEKK